MCIPIGCQNAKIKAPKGTKPQYSCIKDWLKLCVKNITNNCKKNTTKLPYSWKITTLIYYYFREISQ